MASTKGSAIVVGAGLSGLSAAYKLQNAGFEVTVLERGEHPGGRVKTLRRDGFTIDTGPDAMTTGYVEYLKIAEEVGLADSKVSCSQIVGLIRKGRVIDIDPARPVAAMFTPALSWLAKLQFAWGLFRIRKMLKGIDSFNMMNAADLDDEQESAAQFSARHFGRETANYLIDPLLRLTAGNGAAQCSRLGVLGALASGTAELVNINGGLDALPVALAKGLNVIYGADVQSVAEAANGGVNLSYNDGAGESHLLHADAAVIGATYDVAERIYPALTSHAGDYAKSVKFVPLISISLAFGAVPKSQAYAVLIPTVEQPDILLMFLQQNKAPDRVPAGSSLITLYTDPTAAPRLFGQSDEALSQWARQEVERFFPELAGHFKFATVSKWPISGYTAAPGFWRRTRAFHAALPTNTPIQLGGDVFGAGSMESAVAWGVRAAGHIIDQYETIGNEQKISRSEPV